MKDQPKKITVTQPFLPGLDEFIPYLEKIWESKWLTNNGDFHQQFEKELAAFLEVPFISLFTNGTLALITAIQALRITGEVITTPYSFVATTHSLWWNGIKPVFVDIEPNWCNIDASKIEAAITPETTAILPVHVYGNPCETEIIRKIANTYGLKVIYDAAHAFGVKHNGSPVTLCGDLSILSFHSTKIFHTFEGGAIICPDEKTKQRIDYLKNFGFADEVTVVGPGINAKMNEVQAAMGLLQLKHYETNRLKRMTIASVYRKELATIPGIILQPLNDAVEYNYGYFPVYVDESIVGKSRDEVYEELKAYGVFTRRYFYPLISSFSTYRELPSSAISNLPVATEITLKVLCLPIYSDLSSEDTERIIFSLKKIIQQKKMNS